MEKQMIAAGTPNYLGIKPEYSDEQILEYVATIYGWKNVTIIRQPSVVKVQPKKEDGDLRYNSNGEPTLATMVAIAERMEIGGSSRTP